MRINTLTGNIIFILFLFGFSTSYKSVAAEEIQIITPSDTLKFLITDSDSIQSTHVKVTRKTNKFTAIVFALLTGPLGGHRVYLGTTTRVPLIYTITFGGFGTMVVADIIAILVTKDIETFENNDHLFMWISSNN